MPAARSGRSVGGRRAALAGVCAAVAALAASELAAGVVPAAGSLVVAVADLVIEATPGAIVALAIALLGHATRPVLLAGMALVAVLAGGAIGVLAQRRLWPAALGGFGGFALLAAVAGIADPRYPSAAAVGISALAAGVGIGVLAVLRGRSPLTSTGAGEMSADRRAFLRASATVIALAAIAGTAGRLLLERSARELARLGIELPRPRLRRPPPPPDLADEISGLSPLLTPNDDFYRIDTAFIVPRVDVGEYRLRVTGRVRRPLELSYADVAARVDREADVTLACVSNEVGGGLVGTARWLGFPLADLLDEAGLDDGADQIVGRSVDGWTAGFPTEAVFDGRDALVVIGMNGEPLPPRNGFPVRLVVAGLYGYVSDTKWLEEIELAGWADYDAYWIPRGWAKEAPIKTQSRIDVPRNGSERVAGRIAVAGVAWAGERGVARVEVRIDDHPWVDARLSEELSVASWRQWVHEWDASSGEHRIAVRATDGDGEVQTAARSQPVPDGATGHHTIRVTVV